MLQGPDGNGAASIATSMKRLSRRQLLDGGIGIGAFLPTAGAVRAEDPMQSNMEWRDSVIVERKGGQVVFRSRSLDFTAVYMIHCHMMNHEK